MSIRICLEWRGFNERKWLFTFFIPSRVFRRFPCLCALKLTGPTAFWKRGFRSLRVWGGWIFLWSLQFSLSQNLVGTGNPLSEIYWHVSVTADPGECVGCAVLPWKTSWVLSKCRSPGFAERRGKLDILDLASECVLGWKGRDVTENFPCATRFHKFDRGWHTEPNVAFVPWLESSLTAGRCIPGQAIVKTVRSK